MESVRKFNKGEGQELGRKWISVEEAEIPEEFRNRYFEGLKVNNENLIMIEYCKKWVKHYVSGMQGVVISSDLSCGKSLLGAIILQSLMLRKVSCKFCNTSEIIQNLIEFVAEEDKTNINNYLKMLKEVDVLLLDDLNNDVESDWGKKNIECLIEYRKRHNKSTIITTKANSEELKSWWGEDFFSLLRLNFEAIRVDS